MLFTMLIGYLQVGISIIVWNSAWIPYSMLMKEKGNNILQMIT